MPVVEYNQFDNGIQEDDIIGLPWQILEWNNVTWLSTGYGITLWPKVTKQLLTNWQAPNTIFWRELSSWVFDQIAVGCDNWEIYKLNWTDNTPIYTITTNADIVNWAYLFAGSNFMYFAHTTDGSNYNLAQVTNTDFNNETFASINETFLTFNNIDTPPMTISNNNLYVGWLRVVYIISPTWVSTPTWSIFNRYVVWITVHGSNYMVYTDAWEVSYWDWASTTAVRANIPLKFIPSRVFSAWSFDIVLSTEWDYWAGSWYDFKLMYSPKFSNRLDDNSQYTTKFNFQPNVLSWDNVEMWRSNKYFIWNDTQVWLYAWDDLFEWANESFHKLVTRDNTWVLFDNLFTLKHLKRGHSKLFFWFQSWTTTFWVDYIDLTTQTTAKDGSFVTPIFRWPPNQENKINEVRATTSYTNWDNFIKIYMRIDNAASWTLIKNINDSTSTIKRHKIQSIAWSWNITKQFTDIQFKVEMRNNLQTNTPPILHWLELDYKIIW